MTENDVFDHWGRIKKISNAKENRIFFKEGDIFWVHLGVNIGDEEYGKGILFLRPVLIVKKFNTHIFLGIPLTSQQKNGTYYYPIEMRIVRNKKNITSTLLLSQLRVFNAKRLQNSFATISPCLLHAIKEKAKEILFS